MTYSAAFRRASSVVISSAIDRAYSNIGLRRRGAVAHAGSSPEEAVLQRMAFPAMRIFATLRRTKQFFRIPHVELQNPPCFWWLQRSPFVVMAGSPVPACLDARRPLGKVVSSTTEGPRRQAAGTKMQKMSRSGVLATMFDSPAVRQCRKGPVGLVCGLQ